jgi:hypothetical protein
MLQVGVTGTKMFSNVRFEVSRPVTMMIIISQKMIIIMFSNVLGKTKNPIYVQYNLYASCVVIKLIKGIWC